MHFDWAELAFVAMLAAASAAAVFGVYALLIRHAQNTLGIAAAPKVAALKAQRGAMVAVAGIVAGVVVPMIGRTTPPALDWRPYASAVGEYSAEFPGVIKEETVPSPMPDGTTVDIHAATVELDRNGSYMVMEFVGPPLEYETKDRGRLMELNNYLMGKYNAVVERTDFPYPEPWGEVACAETRGHLISDPQRTMLLRSWNTGKHLYSVGVVFRPGSEAEAAGSRFLASVRPTGDYQKPRALGQ